MKLNQAGYRNALRLIRQGKVDTAADWSMSAEDENRILGDPPDWEEYSRWHLAVDAGANEETKERYRYPFGKNGKIYRSALVAIRQRAGQQKEGDIFAAAGRLIEALDGKEKEEAKLCALRSGGELAGVPEWFQVFPYGEVLLEGGEPALMDEQGAALVLAHFNSLEHDMVVDYEHQTLSGEKAPAAGWIKELEWRGEEGLWARVEWTQEAAAYIQKKEYRYFSPVFWRRKSDKRIVELHNVALTNQPLMMNIRALAAKYEAINHKERRTGMLEKLKKMLGLETKAGEEEAVQAVEGLVAKNKELESAAQAVACKEVLEELGAGGEDGKEKVLAAIKALKEGKPAIAKEVLDALEMKEKDLSAVVASIHALKQGQKGAVSREEFDKLQKDMQERDAQEVVAKALNEGKITADQKEWAEEYAIRDLEGFKVFVAKAPVVVPVDKLPGKKEKQDELVTSEATMKVAKMMGNSEEDLKKYAA